MHIAERRGFLMQGDSYLAFIKPDRHGNVESISNRIWDGEGESAAKESSSKSQADSSDQI